VIAKLEQLLLAVLEQLIVNAEAVSTNLNSVTDDKSASSLPTTRAGGRHSIALKPRRIVILMTGRK